MTTLTRMKVRALLLVAVTSLAGAGCINVTPFDGAYSCAKDLDCPNNYFCEPTSHTCYKHGDAPPVKHAGQGMDMSATVDMNDGGGDTQQCHDGTKNGSETDVDCGGSCGPCATGQACLVPHDCASMLCNATTKLCVASKCENGLRDPGETDIDCGGTMCPACGTGKGCIVNADCATDICNTQSMTCAGDLCSDGTKDGMESDVDCGGQKCAHCGTGKLCNSGSDCTSGVCSANGTCAAGLCDNGVKDPGETDIDCGGPCAGCALTKACKGDSDCASKHCNVKNLTCVADACHDGAKEPGETDVDCGGNCGATCNVGQMCNGAGDCASGTCGAGGTCSSSQCSDGSKDGSETDIDCGGGVCTKCAPPKGCKDGMRDCTTTFCNIPQNMCVDSQCKDGAQNGSETDKDCGGGTCPKCALTQGCKVGSTDCISGWCNAAMNQCVDSQCKDGIKDSGESDVDCGGVSTGCAKCLPGKGCGTTDSNCSSGYCNYKTSLCANGQCDDGRQDGKESDEDCGVSCGGNCPAGKKCNTNDDCGTGACDYMPTPHICVTSSCNDHHLDGMETDVDCGGPSCNTCAIGRTCMKDSDCVSDYCDQSAHKCACGGVGQACCTGGQCTQGNLCDGTVTCNGSNTCVAGSKVVCSGAVPPCQQNGTCNPQTGQCSPIVDVSGSCDLSTSNICIVQNTSTCSQGACTGGTPVPDRCDAGNTHVQHCSNNSWNNTATCANGCNPGTAQCNVPTPTVTATVSGSDVIVSWTQVAAGVSCTVYRSDNGGGYQLPASIISPCPSIVGTTCNAFDHFLFRGSYTYRLHCTDGASGASADSAATAAVHPGIELCIGDRGTNQLEVHTPNGNTNDHLERTLSDASLNFTYGVAYLPPASGHTNCAWGDPGCGTIFVTSYSGDQVQAFDRRAYDTAAVDPTQESPSTNLKILTISLIGSDGNAIAGPYGPKGVAVLNGDLVVAMQGNASGTGYLAGYTLPITTGTAKPHWYIQSNATNKLSAPFAVAVDTGSGTSDGNGDVYVGSSFGGVSVVNGYHLTDLRKVTNTTTNNSGQVAPFVTITPQKVPTALAVDPAHHVLYVGTTQTNTIWEYTINGTTVTGPTTLTTPSAAPTGMYFLSDGNTPATLFLVDYSAGAIQSYAAGSQSPTLNFTVPNLASSSGGIVVCN